MRVVDEEPMETLHLYVVPEDQLPPKRDYLAIFMVISSLLVLIGILAITVLAPSPDHDVSFSLAIKGYALAPVSRTIKVTAIATGKQYVPATTATGTITFYNGAIYAQIIPFDTVLTGADGLRVVIDEQAVIPPAAQTTPPTYGRPACRRMHLCQERRATSRQVISTRHAALPRLLPRTRRFTVVETPTPIPICQARMYSVQQLPLCRRCKHKHSQRSAIPS